MFFVSSIKKVFQNMKILRNILAILFLAVSTTVLADDYACLSVVQTSKQNNFTLNTIKRITFDADNMVVTLVDGTQQKLPLASLTKMFFSNEESGIAAIGAQQTQFSMREGVLYVKGAEGSKLTIYDMAGRAVRSVTSSEAETVLPLDGLTKGNYIIKVGNQTKKFQNK